MVVVLCACLLLPVEGLSLQEERGKSLTVSGSLSSDLLIMYGWEGWLRLFSEGWALVPPLPSLLSLLLLGICLSICGWGGSVCFSANLGPSIFSKSRSAPLHLCPPSCFSVFYVAFLFLYSSRDERAVSRPVLLYLCIYLLLMGNSGP